MNTLEAVSQDTLDEIAKALSTGGVKNDTGIVGVDLSGLVSLIPVVAPFRDMLARTTPEQGNKNAQWRALLNINNQQPRPTMAYDASAPLVKIKELDVFAPYTPYGAGYTVTEDAMILGKGYADAKAISISNALNQWKLAEDRLAIGAQNFALARPAVPSLAQVGTGGTITNVQVFVAVAARTGTGYFYGGNSRGNSTSTTFGSGTTNSITCTVASVQGAVAYDWFQSSDGATWFYYTTTSVNKATMTKVIVANEAVPTTLPALSSTVPTVNTAADNGSAQANEFNGLLATLAGDYGSNAIVTPGTGTDVSGAVFQTNDGAGLTLTGGSIAELDALCLALYNKSRVSPSAFMLSSQEAVNLSQKILGSTSATTFLQVDDTSGRTDALAGGFIGRYVNRATAGTIVPLEVHPHVPPGTIIARTDRVPYPDSNITNTLELRMLRDAYDYVYGSDRASGGPRQDGEVRAIGSFINRAPVTMGVVSNIGNA